MHFITVLTHFVPFSVAKFYKHQYQENSFLRFSGKSEAFTEEFKENCKEIFSWYYMYSDLCNRFKLQNILCYCKVNVKLFLVDKNVSQSETIILSTGKTNISVFLIRALVSHL